MNATLGTELPLTNFQNQTTIPLGYADPATEIVRQGDTQLWKITHNGVDTHFIHFHLFNVQVVNRVGWDGSVRPPDANEMGWKDTVRMNPLEDILVALQPITPPTPWPLPNSIRNNDVTGMGNMFSNLNPFSNAGSITVDGPTNFGWEYVWHCHILGHEENDMMRPIIWQVPPRDPANLVAASAAAGGVDISFTDQSANETGFVVQRDIDPAFPHPTSITVAASPTRNAAGEGVDYGSTIKVNDPTVLTSGTTYYYRVQAVDDGFRTPFEQSYNVTGPVVSNWVGPVTVSPVPIAQISATALAFGTVPVGSSTTTLANGTIATVTITNVGTAVLNINSMLNSGANSPDFTYVACTSVNPGSNCPFTVTFAPSAGGPESALFTINTNDPARTNMTVSMTGTGVIGTNVTVAAPAITYGQDGTVTVTATSGTATPTGNVTLSVDGGAPITKALTAGSASFTITAPSAGSHALAASYAAQNGFQANTGSSTLVVNRAPLTITASSGSMNYGGPVPPITPSFSAFLLGQTNLTALTTQPTCSTTATSASPVASYPSACSGAVAPNYAITYVAGTVTIGKASSMTAIVSNLPNPSIIGQIVTIKYSVTPQFPGSAVTGTVTVQASTGEGCSAAPTAGACTITFQTGGTRTLTATYSGDTNVNGSASTTVTQAVSGVSLSTTSLLFGNQVVGTLSAAQQVTLANVGTTTLTISIIQWSPNFSDSNNCGGSLAPGRSCRINVRFAPTTTGVLTGTLTITDSDITSPQIVTLTGTGVQAGVTLSPTSFNFGTVARRSSTTTTFTLTNSGTSSLTINSIRIGGANANQFSIPSSTCGNSLGVGTSCTINVRFSPTSRGTLNATLQVTDNAPNSPQTAALTGTGQ
jgi:Bacterial Ig-like domain (group 3)/MBG domain (YGX type)/Abnormal spindle-like microcephaly-assoc'd, ASPM-SPD-2-Hydin/Multicopper oxidase